MCIAKPANHRIGVPHLKSNRSGCVEFKATGRRNTMCIARPVNAEIGVPRTILQLVTDDLAAYSLR